MALSFQMKLLFGGIGLFVTLFAAYYIMLIRIKKRAKELCGHYVHVSPPQFPNIPIIGNLIGDAIKFISLKNTVEVWDIVTKISSAHPEGCILWLFHLPWFAVSELDVIETVLMSPENSDKSYGYRLLNTITDGIFSINGPRWRKLRKKLNLTFSQKQLDLLYSDMNEQTEICINVLKKNAGQYINIMTFMLPYFLDIVVRSHFGVETHEQKNRHHQITEKAARVIELTIEHRLFRVYNYFMSIFKLSRASQFIEHLKERTLPFIREEIIGKRLADMEIEKSKGVYEDRKRLFYTDFAKEALEELNIEPSIYNIERNTCDMIIAGSDTTSITISALFYYISTYPEVQQKIYEEVLPIYGDKGIKELTKEDLSKMEYLEMVIKETLRHTGPPGIVREINRELDVGKYTIPKGTNLYITIKSIHKDPKYYERANEFYPEHFLPEKVKQRPKFAFLPFSHGPRNCPGSAYAYILLKAIASSVVRNFKLETNIPLEDIKFKMVLMQEHANGYFVKLTPRDNISS